MDFHLRLRKRWLFLSLFFVGLLLLHSIDQIWFHRLEVILAILSSIPKALLTTWAFFVVLKVLDG